MKNIFFLVALFFSVQASAVPLNTIVVFGDSLSDNGNLYEYMKRELPLSPPYFNGRFTNGPVWIELLTRMYYPNDSKAHLLDYAFGGAGVSEEVNDDDDDDDEEVLFTLRREIDSYLLTHHEKADESSLYVVWMGSNNYLAAPSNADDAVNQTILGIKHDLQRLVKKGAKHIMVVDVVDLGKTPAAKDFDAVDLFTELSRKHNVLLKQMVEEMKSEDPSVQWFLFEASSILDEMVNFPDRYGFTNTTTACTEEMMAKPSSKFILKMASSVNKARLNVDACTGYLFFDLVHPSEPGHIAMAEKTKKMLDDADVTFE